MNQEFESLGDLLLVTGLFFPLISVLSIVAAGLANRNDKHVSAVVIPLVGPILLSGGVLLKGLSTWLIPTVWLLDPGTWLLASLGPSLFHDWWKTSSFSRVQTLLGTQGDSRATITLYRTGCYVLVVTKQREEGEASLSHPGTYRDTGESLELTSCSGQQRRLVRNESHELIVEDLGRSDADPDEWSIDRWVFVSAELR